MKYRNIIFDCQDRNAAEDVINIMHDIIIQKGSHYDRMRMWNTNGNNDRKQVHFNIVPDYMTNNVNAVMVHCQSDIAFTQREYDMLHYLIEYVYIMNLIGIETVEEYQDFLYNIRHRQYKFTERRLKNVMKDLEMNYLTDDEILELVAFFTSNFDVLNAYKTKNQQKEVPDSVSHEENSNETSNETGFVTKQL